MTDERDLPHETPGDAVSDDRDLELGAAIEALLVAPRPDGFVADLMARLDDEAALPSSPPSPTAAAAPRWTARRVGRLAAAAVAAAALITVGTLFGVSHDTQRHTVLGPEPATALDVIESSLAVSGAVDNLQGTVVYSEWRNGAFHEVARSAFVVDHEGDLALTQRVTGQHFESLVPMPWATSHMVFDSQSRTTRDVMHFDKPLVVDENGKKQSVSNLVIERDHLGAGPPYEGNGAANIDFPFMRLRSYMLQVEKSNVSPDMRDTTINGRPAWELTTSALADWSGFNGHVGTRVVIGVDKQTRIPVLFRWSSGAARFEARIEGLRVDAPVPADAFDAAIPDGALVRGAGEGWAAQPGGVFQSLPVDDAPAAHAIVGDLAAMPMYRPQGYDFTAATYAKDEKVVSLAFRRGFDAFFVSVQAVGQKSGSISQDGKTYPVHVGDPFGQSYGTTWRYLQRHSTTVVLKQGPFAGYKAHIVVDPSVLPHLYVRGGVMMASVSGDLSVADMVKVTESLTTFWDGK